MFVLGPSCIFQYLVKIIVFIISQRDVFWGYIFNTNKLCLYTMGNVCSYKRYQRSLQSYLSVERANTASVFELMGLSMMGSVGEDIQRKFSPPPTFEIVVPSLDLRGVLFFVLLSIQQWHILLYLVWYSSKFLPQYLKFILDQYSIYLHVNVQPQSFSNQVQYKDVFPLNALIKISNHSEKQYICLFLDFLSNKYLLFQPLVKVY